MKKDEGLLYLQLHQEPMKLWVKNISYLGIFVSWDKIYLINGVIRYSPQKQSYKV